eukprot:7799357-Pyramimonas_sp.AAC.1
MTIQTVLDAFQSFVVARVITRYSDHSCDHKRLKGVQYSLDGPDPLLHCMVPSVHFSTLTGRSYISGPLVVSS